MLIDLTPKDKTGRWFAWRPVWVGHKLAWFEHVERYYGHKGERVFWRYRLVPAPNFTAAKIWNVAADDENGHSQIMCVDWMTRAAAEQFAVHYTENYVGKPYPNGKGHYSITNIRLVREVSTDE